MTGELKVLECFAGIGACSQALTNLGISHEIVDAVEIDSYAISSFNAIHHTNFEPQDITLWDKNIDVDLIMQGSPCQDFSVAGKQAGGDKGSNTRSSLMYETIRIVGKLRPKYVIWENVKNLLSKNHRHNFDAYLSAMSSLGYTNYYKVLNARDFGVPQNRERVFTISIRDDLSQTFEFPEPVPLTKCLEDILEDEVEERFYLSDKQLDGVEFKNPEVSFCLDANYHKGTNVNQYLKKHRRQIVRVGGLYDKNGSVHQAGSVYDPRGIAATLSTMQGGNQEPIIKKDRVRRLTPKECWRLMSFPDDAFERAQAIGTSNSKLYKQAGNSICVAVLEAILEKLLCQ